MLTRSAALLPMLLLMLLASCSPAPGGGPSAPPMPSAAGTASRYGAPTVLAERQFGARANAPCALLDAADLAAIGMEPGSARPKESSVGPSCRWYSTLDRDFPSLTLTTTPGRNVLVDAYRVRVYPIFRPTTVAGLPAEAETSRPDDPICVVTMAVNNDEGLSAWWYADEPVTPATEPCTNAMKALAAVVAHLPPR